jgi:hypothetical protein
MGLENLNTNTREPFQMNRSIRRQMKRDEARIARRLQKAEGGQKARDEGPEFSGRGRRYELSDRTRAIPYGGLPVIHELVHKVGLVQRLDEQLRLLKIHRPYLDSDHILNIAFNLLCGGRSLEDIEVRRNDAAFLDALGARSIPDPTTAGDYARRFSAEDLRVLQRLFNDVRVCLSQQQPESFRQETARIDADGTYVHTSGECKEGMDINYKGDWGFHPLLVSFANTGEPLWVLNRPGNRPSHEGAPELFDESIELMRRAGFEDILLRGDTDFSLTAHFDKWNEQGVRFVFGYDTSKNLVQHAQSTDESEYERLVRSADEAFGKQVRAKPPRVKDAIVRARGFKNLTLEQEDLIEFDYKPTKTRETYRMVALRKTLRVQKGQLCLGIETRYHFYVTNDRSLSMAEVVRESNDRCNQERLIDQLKHGVRALRAPLNNLVAKNAYMVMAALAWSIKAWFALSLPLSPRWRERHRAVRDKILHMEFDTFVQNFILLPAQILRSGRRRVVRFLAWRPSLPTVFRLVDALDGS